jgi:hypothetical protein
VLKEAQSASIRATSSRYSTQFVLPHSSGSTIKSGANPRSDRLSGDSTRAICSSARINAAGLRVNSTA